MAKTTLCLALMTLALAGLVCRGEGRHSFERGWTRACDEIYVVSEGETLQTISEKCGDPYIVEKNPHIYDPDDVFPGLVIRITPVHGSL